MNFDKNPQNLAVWLYTPLLNGRDKYVITFEQTLNAQVNYTQKWPNCPWSPLWLPSLPSLGLNLWFYEEFPVIS
jgi:hypothetical protein